MKNLKVSSSLQTN